MKLVNKGLKKIGTKFLGKTINIRKCLGNFKKNIKKLFNRKGKHGKIGNFVKREFAKDIVIRRDKYKSAIPDITKDLALGNVTTEKISKLIIYGVYNGFSRASIDYINKVMGEKKALSKKVIEGGINSISTFLKGFTNDMINNKDYNISIKHNMYQAFKNPIKQWANEKLKTDKDKDEFNEVQSVIFNSLEKSIDSIVLDIIDNKKALFNQKGEFNIKLIEDFLAEMDKNKYDANKKYFNKKFFEQLNKKLDKNNNKKND